MQSNIDGIDIFNWKATKEIILFRCFFFGNSIASNLIFISNWPQRFTFRLKGKNSFTWAFRLMVKTNSEYCQHFVSIKNIRNSQEEVKANKNIDCNYY